MKRLSGRQSGQATCGIAPLISNPILIRLAAVCLRSSTARKGPTRGALPLPTVLAGTVRHTGGCLQPVLLRGRADYIDGGTGELIHRYTTVHEPGGVLPIACKTRRASRCPPCAEVYRADTYQLIRAGLSGGKGVPATVADHPCVFVTLTAPSFGPVHSRREKDGRFLRCRPSAAGSSTSTPSSASTAPPDRPRPRPPGQLSACSLPPSTKPSASSTSSRPPLRESPPGPWPGAANTTLVRSRLPGS